MDDLTAKAITHYHKMAYRHLYSPPNPLVASIAISFLEKALSLAPHHIKTHLALAEACRKLGRTDEALYWCQRALEVNPRSIAARFHLCMMQIPVLYENVSEIASRRRNYEQHLQQLIEAVDTNNPEAINEAARMIGLDNPYYLPYSAENDRALQQAYGAFVCKILARRYPQWSIARELPPLGHEGPVRVGVVSGHFSPHVVFQAITNGWLSELDRHKFEVFIYALKADPCQELEYAKSCSKQWVEGPLSLDAWCERIRDDQVRVLVYPEVGMNPMAIKLAGLRLAPVQCMAGGHPETSGLPTMDYFLSSELAEPPEGSSYYTEKLVRLPNMSAQYRMPLPSAVKHARADFGLQHDAVIYLCIQTLTRYLPQHDKLYARIASQVPNCQLVFVKHDTYEPISRIMARRLKRAFADLNLNWEDHVVLLPHLNFDDYHALQDVADIYLDSINWNGDTTTINAIAHALPIVTVPGRFLRGRRGMGMLAMLGVTDTIAADCDRYVEIAVSLGRDAERRRNVREKMALNKHKVFNDRKCIDGLEDFLLQAAKGSVDGATK